MTVREEDLLLELLQQEDRERVTPKLEKLRNPKRVKVVYGGRGAGGKSHSIASLILQKCQYEKTRVACLREVQKSLSESVHELLKNKIEQLGYQGWTITNEYIKHTNGSYIIFRGLKDLKAANQIKSLEGFDVFWVEEAATVSHDSWRVLVPTLRKPGSELWISFNREEESDPCYERFVEHVRDDAYVIWCEPGKIDNPWWTDELQKEMEEDYKYDPNEAEHVWGGEPRKQGINCVMSRVAIRGAMKRTIEAVGQESLGIDVARFGDDETTIVHRKGMKVLKLKVYKKLDTQEIAQIAWDMIDRRPYVPIKVDDTGVGAGVSDALKKMGAKVIMVNFGGSPQEKDKYTTVADEMWFGFPVDEADIPDDKQLSKELSGRQFSYMPDGRRKIEPKKEYKKRTGKSPDRADGLLLAFYEPQRLQISLKTKKDLAKRRKRV